MKLKHGYICDICGKEVTFKTTFLPNYNTIKWSHPEGGWGERDATETIYFCSMSCLQKALKKVYFGASVKLSYDFLEDFREKNG